jgi:hypothetical protein
MVCARGWPCLLEAHLAHLLSLFLKKPYMQMRIGATAGDSLSAVDTGRTFFYFNTIFKNMYRIKKNQK